MHPLLLPVTNGANWNALDDAAQERQDFEVDWILLNVELINSG